MKKEFLGSLRIASILLLAGVIIQALLVGIYHLIGLSLHFHGIILSFLGILAIIFVLYRNKWQFHGFYNGKKKERLPQKLSALLIVLGIIFLILAPFIF